MKKLMIAAAIVCAVAYAQAAQIDWSFAENVKLATYATGGHDLTGYTAYLFTETAWGDFTGLAADEKTVDNFKGYLTSAGISDSTSTGTVKKYTTGAQVLNPSDGGNFYIVLANDKEYLASAVLAADPYTSTEQHRKAAWTINATSSSISPIEKGSFTAFASVPEPTSGLLLLLGVAGLALRRRRA